MESKLLQTLDILPGMWSEEDKVVIFRGEMMNWFQMENRDKVSETATSSPIYDMFIVSLLNRVCS